MAEKISGKARAVSLVFYRDDTNESQKMYPKIEDCTAGCSFSSLFRYFCYTISREIACTPVEELGGINEKRIGPVTVGERKLAVAITSPEFHQRLLIKLYETHET